MFPRATWNTSHTLADLLGVTTEDGICFSWLVRIDLWNGPYGTADSPRRYVGRRSAEVCHIAAGWAARLNSYTARFDSRTLRRSPITSRREALRRDE
jgi:hypothetical protein